MAGIVEIVRDMQVVDRDVATIRRDDRKIVRDVDGVKKSDDMRW